MTFFRVDTVFEHPPEDVTDYITDMDKRLKWDGQNFEKIEIVAEYPMETTILYIKTKS